MKQSTRDKRQETRNRLKHGLLVACCLLLVAAPSALAQGLVPQCEGLGCDPCVFLKLVENVINFMLYVIFPLAVLYILYGGFTVMTAAGSVDRMKRGREIITISVVGIAIALGAWLVISSVIQVISGNSWRPWNSIQCTPRAPVTIQPPTAPTAPVTLPPGSVDEDEGRRIFREAGITLNQNKAPCPAGVRYQDVPGGCTTIAGVKKAAIDELIRFKNECNCTFQITGGAELGHAAGSVSHASGNKIDISVSTAVDGYIENNYTFIGVRGDGARMYRDSNSIVYAKEDNPPHWDVCYGC